MRESPINSQETQILSEEDKTIKALVAELLDPFIERLSQEDHVPLRSLLSAIERAILVRFLSDFNGNQKETSDYLGLKLSTLNEKIKKHNIHFRKEPY